MDKKIKLRNDTQMNTGYEGRGIPVQYKTFSAGTEVFYNKYRTSSGIYHNIWVIENGIKWEASKKEQ